MTASSDIDSEFSSVRKSLRAAQQSADMAKLREILDRHPELEFTDSDSDLLAILAVVFIYLQQGDHAQQCLQDINPDSLTDSDARSDYGLALLLAGRTEEAEAILDRVVREPDTPAEAFVRQGGAKIALNHLSDAQDAYQNALDRQPERAEWLNNLGGVKFRLGLFQEAIDFYDRALALQPGLPQSIQMRTRALMSLDRMDEIIDEAQDALNKNPDEPMAHLHLALVQRQSDLLQQAEATLDAAVDRFTDRDDLKQALVSVIMEQQNWAGAGLRLKDWVDERDEPDWTLLLLNRVRIEARFLDAADASLAELADTPLAEDPIYPVLQAKILIERSQADEAVDILYAAMDKFPGHAEIRSLLTLSLTSLGRMEEAESCRAQTMATNPMAVVNRVAERNHEADDNEIAQMEKLFETEAAESDQRARVGFVLAAALDKQKKYERAFAVLKKTNAMFSRRMNYNWRVHRKMTQKQIDIFTPDVVERLAGKGWTQSNRPIFVLGMPRSGTTLTEQILCSHPEVYGAGELNWVPKIRNLMPKVVQDGKPYPEAMQVITERNLKSAASYYLKRIAQQENQSPRVVDKLPHNFDNLGLIALMFPQSTIIHLDREPRDVAISNFFQNFAAHQGLMGFAYDLEDIGHMLNDHIRIMEHWHSLFPGRIFELNYQELVSDPENVIHRLLDHCGLAWDDRVLKFYETKRPVRTASIRQVRQGIYTSSAQKWRRFEPWLDPLETILAQGYCPPSDNSEDTEFSNLIAGTTSV